MKRLVLRATAMFAPAAGVLGCANPQEFLNAKLPPPGRDLSVVANRPTPPAVAARTPASMSEKPVIPAGAKVPDTTGQPSAAVTLSAPTGVDEFVRIAVGRNPRIARATIAIDAAQGRYVQAGLYPNPELAVSWDEIGDRSSPDRLGIVTAPRITQTIVTGKKLSLSQAVAAREIDQATLDLLGERYAVVASVRASFYEAYTLQQRAELLEQVVKLSEEAVAKGRLLLENQQIARLDLVQLELERERYRADALAAAKELPAALRKLAAVTGDSGLTLPPLNGTFEGLPAYDLQDVRAAVVAAHPEVRAAKVGVERAQAAVRRAAAEPIPNVAVYGAFIRQFENRSYDGAVGLSMAIPVWNKNQGNIRAAQAELGMAIQGVARVENDLAGRVATAFQTYAGARQRAEQYRTEILPRATETFELSLKAFKGGQFEYLRVVQAQRAIAEAKIELNRSLGEAWRAAAELSGLLLEESWPGPAPAANPGPAPAEPLPNPAKVP